MWSKIFIQTLDNEMSEVFKKGWKRKLADELGLSRQTVYAAFSFNGKKAVKPVRPDKNKIYITCLKKLSDYKEEINATLT